MEMYVMNLLERKRNTPPTHTYAKHYREVIEVSKNCYENHFLLVELCYFICFGFFPTYDNKDFRWKPNHECRCK